MPLLSVPGHGIVSSISIQNADPRPGYRRSSATQWHKRLARSHWNKHEGLQEVRKAESYAGRMVSVLRIRQQKEIAVLCQNRLPLPHGDNCRGGHCPHNQTARGVTAPCACTDAPGQWCRPPAQANRISSKAARPAERRGVRARHSPFSTERRGVRARHSPFSTVWLACRVRRDHYAPASRVGAQPY